MQYKFINQHLLYIEKNDEIIKCVLFFKIIKILQ